MESHICVDCKASFVVSDKEKVLYAEKGVSTPLMCPDCRHQRRLLFRNEQHLYRRPCNKCNKQFVSIYAPDKPYVVYCPDCFWSDTFSPLEYGRSYDFSRSFFEQFRELQLAVPVLGNTVFNSTNCEYNGFCVDSKDCYMCTRVGGADGCMYSYLVLNALECIDCLNVYNSQYCYECIDCWSCYNSSFSQMCRNCSDCAFCYDCIGCRNCFGCIGLRNAEYYFFNEKCTKEEYERRVSAYVLSSHSALSSVKNHVFETLQKMPHRPLYEMNSQNAHGDFISESKEVLNSFDVEKSESIINSWGVEYSKDIVDGDFMYYAERCYNSISNSKSTHCDFCFAMLGGNYDCTYSMLLFNNSHDCFGSISMKKGAYTILNKQYEKEEYVELKEKIIAQMQVAGTWGQFFPPELSYFGYNEVPASLYFPLSKEDVLAKGFNWYESPEKSYSASSYAVPDTIGDVSDSIMNEALSCEVCGKNYKVVVKELAFYRAHKLPIPRRCHLCRHADRLSMRPPRKLFERSCAHCHKPMTTSYSPDNSATVYCDECYKNSVYS